MIARSVVLVILAGLMEIGGGYLMWLCSVLSFSCAYGIIHTLQPAHFGRVDSAYGGVFVVMSMLWGWWIDGQRSDRLDIVGASS